MIVAQSFKGKKVALFGLGGSGVATARALTAGGAELTAFDDNPQRVEKAAQEGIATANLRESGLAGFSCLVLSPGVPLTHPQPHWSVQEAKRRGLVIIGDIEILYRELQAAGMACPLICITGTNGKSTTTALISHILAHAGRDVQMGGNIGTAALSLAPFSRGRVYVVECSSYQIDLAPSLAPAIGVLLNLAPDHLDRHGTMDNYAAIKERLIAKSDVGIVGTDDSFSAAIASFYQAKGRRIVQISARDRLENGIYADGSRLVRARAGAFDTLIDLDQALALRGQHNAQNAAAAWAACREIGLTDAEIRDGMLSFPGLAHRMEPVASVGTTLFVNDSKATNAEAAARALASFEQIYWIAGGLPKSGGIASLRPYFDKIVKAYLIGEAAPEFAATLAGTPYEISGTVEQAVKHAAADAARAGGNNVVLLSPACASFDQFPNFEIRGDNFRNAVLSLSDSVPVGETGR